MKNKKKIIIAISAMIVILAIAIVLIIKLVSINKNKENEIIEVSNDIEIDNNKPEENVIEKNTEENEELNEIIGDDETQSGEEVNGTINTPVADSEQEIDKETFQKQETDKEKAINIAKKDWGTDNTVYFSDEGVDNGKYRVTVRDSNTTYILREYIIDVDNETFTIKE